MLVRTNNNVRNVITELIELGFTEQKTVYSSFAPDTLFVNISNKTYTVVNSNGFIEASKTGKLAQYHYLSDGGELVTYVKEFVATEKKPDDTPLATQKPKRATRKKKTETKTEPTND